MNQNWKKIFIKIYTGQSISIITSGIVQFIIILYITKTTQSAFYLSLASIAGFLPQGILSIFIGTFIDKNSRKKIMIYADLFIASITFILIIVINLNLLNINLLLLFLAIRSVGTAFHSPALQASIPLIVPKENLLKYNSYIMTIQSASLVISPAIGALLYDYFSLSLIISLDIIGAIFAVSMFLIVKIPEVINTDTNENNYFSDLKDGIKIIKNNKKIRELFLYVFIFTVLYMPINALIPLLVISYFEMQSIHLGVVEGLFAFGMLIGSYIIGKFIVFKNLDLNVILSCLLIAVFLVITGVLTTDMFSIFAVLSFIAGFGGPLFHTSFSTIIGKNIDPNFLGRVYSNSMAFSLIAMLIGLLASSLFVDDIGIREWFLITGILMSSLVVYQIYNYLKSNKNK